MKKRFITMEKTGLLMEVEDKEAIMFFFIL